MPQSLQRALLASILTAALAAALTNVAGLQATCQFGRGTSDSPWLVDIRLQPLKTGDAVVFRDAYGEESLGLLDGRTYYVRNRGDSSFQLAATPDGPALTGLVAVGIMAPLRGGSTEGNVVATAALVLGMLVMQACVRITLAVKSAALPEVVGGKDLLNGNGLSQAGGALFQVLGAGLAFGFGAVFPSWLVVVLGSATLVVASAVARRIRRLEVVPHTTTFLQEVRRVAGDVGRGVREVASRPPAAFGLSAFQMLRYQFWGFALMVFALYARSLVASGSADTLALGIVGGGGFLGGALGLTAAPHTFALEANYPNPFNPSTSVAFSVDARSLVTLRVYNVLGQEVARLVDGVQSAGRYEVRWNGRNDAGLDLSSGIYFYRLHAGSFVDVKKMLYLK